MAISYGQRFRELREKAGLTQEQVARRLKYKRAAPVSLLERKTTKVPKPATIAKHADALGCKVYELLAGVPTLHDQLRTRTPLSDAELSAWLWGWAYAHPKDLAVVLEQLQTFVDEPQPAGKPTLAGRSDPAPQVTTARTAAKTHRGKKRA